MRVERGVKGATGRSAGVRVEAAKINGVGESDFTAEVLDADVPVLVDFWAHW